MNKNNESVLQWAIEYNDKKHVYDHPIATFSKHELIALYHALRSSEYIKVNIAVYIIFTIVLLVLRPKEVKTVLRPRT